MGSRPTFRFGEWDRFQGMYFDQARMYSMESTSVERIQRDPDPASLFSDLIRLETELWDLVEARLRRDNDLALSWFEPMQVIDRTPGCRVIDIAEALSITIGGTSKLVDRIQNAGWCQRSPNPDDRRSSMIELTRAGRRLLVAARHTFTDEVGTLLGEPLSTSELQRFAATVNKLRAHIHQQRRSA
jgi:DNA-binding MarR family transcriptional regulator